MSDEQVGFVLRHPCGLRIAQDLPEAEVRSIDGVLTRDMRTGYIWYDLPESEIAGQVVGMSLCFFEGKLWHLNVAVVNEELFGGSWADWTEQKERDRAEATRRWFADVGYAVGTYPWGIVYADTDMKTGDGGGGIRFS
jgi:hypothetical protein